MKREHVLSWDEYFMGLAHLSAMRSKDPSTQVGAVIVDQEHKVVGIGYNGLPIGCSDDEFPWDREGGMLETKYAFVVHAELNAILNSTRDLHGCTLYVSLFPCNECARRSFRVESAKSSMKTISMRRRITSSLPRRCSMRRAWNWCGWGNACS